MWPQPGSLPIIREKHFAHKCQNLDLDRRWLCSFRRNSHQCCFLWCEVTGMGLFSSKFDDDSIWVRRNAPYLSCPNWEKNCIFHSLTDLKVFPVSCYYHFWSFHEKKVAELKKWWIYINHRGIQYNLTYIRTKYLLQILLRLENGLIILEKHRLLAILF